MFWVLSGAFFSCRCESVINIIETSDIPRGWEISVDEVLEELNTFSSCRWYEPSSLSDPEVPLVEAGEPFEINFGDVELISVSQGKFSEDNKRLRTCDSSAKIAVMLDFLQNEDTYSDKVRLNVKDRTHEMDTDPFKLKEVGLPDGIRREEFLYAKMNIIMEDDFIKGEGGITEIKLIVSQTTDPYSSFEPYAWASCVQN